MALSCVVSEIFKVENYRDLEIQVTGQSKSLKYHSTDWVLYCMVLVFSSNFVPKTRSRFLR